MKSNVVTMSENSNMLFVGIDVHKKQWSICIRTTEFEHRTFTQPAKPIVLHEYLQRNFPSFKVKCGYEAGCFGYWISEQLQSFGYECLVLNPADIPGSDKESKQKTDHNDCRKIARELSKGEIKSIYQPNLTQQSFRNLFRQRNTLCEHLREIKCQIRSFLSFVGIMVDKEFENNVWSRRFKQWLNELPIEGNNRLTLNSMLRRLNFLYDEFILIEKQLRQYVRINHKVEYKLLNSIPGIGPIVSVAVLSELGDLSRFKRIDNLCSYVGLIPNIYQSGETIRINGLTNRCHCLLRSYFIESAWTAVRKDPELINYYKKFIGKKVAGKIIVKVARKLLVRMYYCMKYKKAYIINNNNPVK
jgi:transposase